MVLLLGVLGSVCPAHTRTSQAATKRGDFDVLQHCCTMIDRERPNLIETPREAHHHQNMGSA